MRWTLGAAVVAAVWMTGCGVQTVAPPPDTGGVRQLLHHRGEDKLGLTDEQKAKLEALKAKVKASIDTSKLEGLTELLAAEQLDKDKLKPALSDLVAMVDKAMDAKLDFLEDFRELLTDEQRQKLTKHRHQHKDKCRCGQKHVFLEALLGNPPRELWSAMRAFMTSGDEDALRAAFKSDKTADERVTGMLAALEAMSAEERASLVKRMKRMAKRST